MIKKLLYVSHLSQMQKCEWRKVGMELPLMLVQWQVLVAQLVY